jgi:hypothetical protein
VRVILDENLWPETATALNVFESHFDLHFEHINQIAPGAQDEEIPEICREQGAIALVSANVRDFGARRIIFEALLASGISVIVPRPSKRATLTPQVQVSMLMRHIERISTTLRQTQEPVLLRLTEGGITEVSLEQLVRESGQ